MDITRDDLVHRLTHAKLGIPFLIQMNDQTYRIKVFKNTCPDNPRKATNHNSHLLLWHPTLVLGDSNRHDTLEDALNELAASHIRNLKWYERWDSMSVYEKFSRLSDCEYVVILPIYSGGYNNIVLETERSSWDSSLRGFIFEEAPNNILPGTDWKGTTALRLLKEVDTYNGYINGHVYTLCIERWTGRAYEKPSLVYNNGLSVFVQEVRGARYWGRVVSCKPGDDPDTGYVTSGSLNSPPFSEYGTSWKAYANPSAVSLDEPIHQLTDDSCFRLVQMSSDYFGSIKNNVEKMVNHIFEAI